MPIPRDEENVSGSQDDMLSATSHGDALRAAVEEEMNLLMDGEYQQEPMHETVGMFQSRVQDRVRDFVRNPPTRYPPLRPPTVAEHYVIASPIPSVVGRGIEYPRREGHRSENFLRDALYSSEPAGRGSDYFEIWDPDHLSTPSFSFEFRRENTPRIQSHVAAGINR